MFHHDYDYELVRQRMGEDQRRAALARLVMEAQMTRHRREPLRVLRRILGIAGFLRSRRTPTSTPIKDVN